jgi:peptidoglycan/xylan/chitin deacetylase (PgdA/CDA1 family)
MNKKIVVLTFDEPEFDFSYQNGPNHGKGFFSKISFYGKANFKDMTFSILLKKGVLRGAMYFVLMIIYYLRAKFKPYKTIFEILKENEIKATFFGVYGLLNENESYVSLFSDILDKGHELGLHGFYHDILKEKDFYLALKTAKDKLNHTPISYSAPWGKDSIEIETIISDSCIENYRVYDEKIKYQNKKIKKIKYYSGFKNEYLEEDIIIWNIHAIDIYPLRLTKFKNNIEKLKIAGFEFQRFDNYCKLFN